MEKEDKERRGERNSVNFSEGVLFTTVNKGYYVEIYSSICVREGPVLWVREGRSERFRGGFLGGKGGRIGPCSSM